MGTREEKRGKGCGAGMGTPPEQPEHSADTLPGDGSGGGGERALPPRSADPGGREEEAAPRLISGLKHTVPPVPKHSDFP